MARTQERGAVKARRTDQRVESMLAGYRPLATAWDECYGPDGRPRRGAARVMRLIDELGVTEFRTRQRLADHAFLRGGITFSVYSDNRGVERIFPFDVIPRIVGARDWARLERGLEQRVRALNAFLCDVYGEQHILRDGVVPRELVEGSAGWLPQVCGIRPRGGVYVHVAGIDLIRGPDGEFLVLEDNLRTPSGVSYVLENRAIMKRALPRIFAASPVRPVDEYPQRLRESLLALSPVPPEDTRLVVLTPGPFNSAYFEHAYLARRMGCDLVQPSDLVVVGDEVLVKTTRGPDRVHVIYRRVDDDFLDPEVFRKDSLLGVRGLTRAYAAGKVTLANALGNGVADDKGIYPFVPAMIRYYLAEDALLPQVETLMCAREADRRRVLEALDQMVVKAVGESGGYGMLMGPQATANERSDFAERVRKNPRGYIAQPRIEISTCPTWTGQEVAPRRVDLRPYIVTGPGTWVLPGGLTRVALREGSYVVNSSQGGGSKDTWVLGADTDR
jgi:uncharacterized circularly permuted ATP-grasp superfamily protein